MVKWSGTMWTWGKSEPFEMPDVNKIGTRIMVDDRPSVIVERFTTKHFIVEFEDDKTRKECIVKELRIGGDVIL